MPGSTCCSPCGFGRWRKASRGRAMGRTMAAKIWEDHVVAAREGEPDLLYVDLHLVHEVTSPQAFESLRLNHRRVRPPDLTVATMDHDVPTRGGRAAPHVIAQRQMSALEENCWRGGNPPHRTGHPP